MTKTLTISTGANKTVCAHGMYLNTCVFASSMCDDDGLVTRSCPRILVTLWTVAYQAPLSMGFPRQEHWSGLPFPSPGDLPDLGIELEFPALQVVSCISGGFFID